jgi:predicted DsbA family dithiol-disulfide isomerase
METLFGLLEASDINIGKIKKSLDSGMALAALMSDYRVAREYNIKGSPTLIMNEGRQSIFGNVGYRVLQANVEELLKNATDQASWC